MTASLTDNLSALRTVPTAHPYYRPRHVVRWRPAQSVAVGRQLLTPDGWQTINGLLIFADADQVSVFTDERDDLMTDGWRFTFGEPVQTRTVPTEQQEHQARRIARREAHRLRRLAMAAAKCPDWCVEHYDGGDNGGQRNHSSEPLTVDAANVWTGDRIELGLWMERRDDRDTGEVETFGVLEVKPIQDNIELTAPAMRELARRLNSFADRVEMRR
jgi:uncharacterized protein DUF6907